MTPKQKARATQKTTQESTSEVVNQEENLGTTEAVQESEIVEQAEVTETTTEVEAAPVEEIAKPEVVETPLEETTVDKFEIVRVHGTSVQKQILAVLDEYKSKMAPGIPVEPEDQAKFQYKLWNALLTVINNCPAGEFRETWNIILSFFQEERAGIFHSNYMYRGAAEWRWNARVLEEFQALLNLISLTRDRSTRDLGLKQVDIGRTLSESYTPQGRQKMLSYYGK